jgi:hypothetical protein
MSDQPVCRGVVTHADREDRTMLVALEGGGTAAAWVLNPLDVAAGDALSGALRARGIQKVRNETGCCDVFALFADDEAALTCSGWPSQDEIACEAGTFPEYAPGDSPELLGYYDLDTSDAGHPVWRWTDVR